MITYDRKTVRLCVKNTYERPPLPSQQCFIPLLGLASKQRNGSTGTPLTFLPVLLEELGTRLDDGVHAPIKQARALVHHLLDRPVTREKNI